MRYAVGVLGIALLTVTTTAQARMLQNVARGLSLVDAQISSIEKDRLSNGWDMTVIAPYYDRRISIGVADLTLDGTLTAKAGFSTRLLPEAHFSLTTGSSPLTYEYNVVGSQDLKTTGSLLVDVDVTVNALGFYDQQIQISNRVDGDFGSITEEQLNYDIGPIDVSGNLYVDILANLTQPLFDAAGQENPLLALSGRSTRVASLIETAEDLADRLKSGDVLNSKEISELVTSSLALSILDPKAAENLPNVLSLTSNSNAVASADVIGPSSVATPEPATLGLLLLTLLWIRPRRMW